LLAALKFASSPHDQMKSLAFDSDRQNPASVIRDKCTQMERLPQGQTKKQRFSAVAHCVVVGEVALISRIPIIAHLYQLLLYRCTKMLLRRASANVLISLWLAPLAHVNFLPGLKPGKFKHSQWISRSETSSGYKLID
jgi:hypothetical protein